MLLLLLPGLPLPAKPKMVAVGKRGGRRGRGGKKGKGRKKVYSDSDSSFECDSESSEDEWQPWKEETKKKPRGKGILIQTHTFEIQVRKILWSIIYYACIFVFYHLYFSCAEDHSTGCTVQATDIQCSQN